MTDLTEALARIESGLERLDRNVLLGALQTGLSRNDVERGLRTAGLPTDERVEALYAWRNGTRTSAVTLDDIHLFPGFYLLSLEDAIANYRSFVANPRWSPGWLPLFANAGGDFYHVDLAGEPAGLIHHLRIEQSEHPVEFRTLSRMVSTVAIGFDRGIFYVDPHGYLEMDDVAFAALAAELNPDVPWWTA